MDKHPRENGFHPIQQGGGYDTVGSVATNDR